MKKLCLVAFFYLASTLAASADWLVVTSCGTLPPGIIYALGQTRLATVDLHGQACPDSGGGGGGGVSVNFGGAIGPVGTPGGFEDDSGNFQPLLGDATNGEWVNVKSITPPATWPLPTGAATQSTLATILSTLQASLSVTVTNFPTTQAISGNIGINNAFSSPVPMQEVDAANIVAVAGTGNATCSSVCLNTTLFSFDTTGYAAVSVQVTSAGSSTTVTYQGSNDNSTWVTIQGYTAASFASSGSLANNLGTTNSAGIFVFPISYRYFRAQITAYGSGTLTEFYVLRGSFNPGTVAIAGGGNNSNLNNNFGVSANIVANAGGGYTYSHIAAGTATSVIKNGAGFLHTITFNSAASATNVTTIYDNASGAGLVIGIPAATTITFGETLTYDIAFTLGLTIITTTANGGDMTVAFK